MTKNQVNSELDMERDLQGRVKSLLDEAPWIMRVTEFRDKPPPVLVVRQRFSADVTQGTSATLGKSSLRDRGILYGQSLRLCLPVIRLIVGRVCDNAGIPLDLQRFLANGRMVFRGDLPLDEEAGAKLSLIFRLQERVDDVDRVELIARRVDRFSREEAVYWLTRVTHYGEAASRWACSGMRLMLGGQPGDKAIRRMLDELRG
jgi:hypothetical protein